jgi:hypothetical protein
MSDLLTNLASAVRRWRDHDVEDYWISVSYMGPAVNRFGDHDLTFVGNKLWHSWDGGWREILPGSDWWLFSVSGAFAWTRDIVTRGISEAGLKMDFVELAFNEVYGYVEFLRVRMPQRSASNFTYEVRRFGTGSHPSFKE